MDFILPLAAVVSVLAFVAIVGREIYDLLSGISNYLFAEKLHGYALRKPLEVRYQVFIKDQFSYYQKLTPPKKKLFESKVQYFIDSKKFIAGDDLELVSDEMKALVGATAIQITFGFPKVYLEHFDRIYLFNDVYKSRATGNFHQGEVHTAGYIALSWKRFVGGYSNETDGINLGLHEMAHALRLENAIMNGEYSFIDTSALLEFTVLARDEMAKIAGNEGSFFRRYAASNDQEFFAVAVENFFERPYEFHQHNPLLYKSLSALLNQDTLASS